ncbi:MAG: efflux transporter outer membrane subunit [Bacteroidales bacterium]
MLQSDIKKIIDVPFRFSWIVILIGVVAGCKVGPDYERPGISLPDTYRFSETTDTSSLTGWWKLFDNPELDSLVAFALENNQDIAVAAERVLEARAVTGYQKSDLYPSIGYDGTAGRGIQFVPNSGVGGPWNTFSGVAQLAWELDFWGKYRRANEAARAELLATENARRAVQLSVITDITQLYFSLLDYRARLDIAKCTYQSRLESLRIIKDRFDEGVSPELDLNQAQIQAAIAEAAIPQYERLTASTENALAVLLGVAPKAIDVQYSLNDQKHVPVIPAGLPSQLLERRPDVLMAEYLLAAQSARIGVAQAMRFPSISLTGMLGAASSELSTLTSGDAIIWSVAGGITGPIFQWGKNKRRVDIERARFRQDSLYYVQTLLNAFREVEDALVEVKTLERESEIRQRQMEAAENASVLSFDRYQGGVTSYLEVLDSQRSEFDAQLSASETYQRYLSSYIRLYKALGGGWNDRDETVNAGSQ